MKLNYHKGANLMSLPVYYLPQPPVRSDVSTIESFERLFAGTVAQGSAALIDYTLSVPKWQFLNYVCEHKGVVLHGSGTADIAEFEPRKSNDVAEFGDRKAVYAASDGIWSMYFAIVDRPRHVRSLVNACFRIVTSAGRSEPFYYFSVNSDALPHNPWRNGTVYLLPADTFEPQPMQRSGELDIEAFRP